MAMYEGVCCLGYPTMRVGDWVYGAMKPRKGTSDPLRAVFVPLRKTLGFTIRRGGVRDVPICIHYMSVDSVDSCSLAVFIVDQQLSLVQQIDEEAEA